MKSAVCLAAILLAGCASRDGFIDQESIECAPGQPVSIQVGVDFSHTARMERADDQFSILVQVSNNSHDEVTVVRIRTEQAFESRASYQLDAQSRRFNETISPGEQHVFEIPTTGRVLVRPDEYPRAQAPVVTVRVALANGDEYRCAFQIDDPS